MGTRNLTMVVVDNEIKVAQYCQWDGYPTGQGQIVSDFIRNELDIEVMKNKVRELSEISTEELQKLWVECGASKHNEFVDISVAEKFHGKYPEFYRDTGANILSMIQQGIVKRIQNDIEFANDSLFCEWAYLIDLDNEVLEIYKGFNKDKLTKKDRFFKIFKNKKN